MPKGPVLTDSPPTSNSRAAEEQHPDDQAREERSPGPFADMLLNAPGSIASLLRRFHKQKSAKRYHLAAEVATCSALRHQVDAFLSSGLPVALIEIASDSSIYKRWRQDQDAMTYAANVLGALTKCVEYLQSLPEETGPDRTRATVIPCLKELMYLSEKLWTTLWNKRTILFPYPAILASLKPEPIVHPTYLSEQLVTMALILVHLQHAYDVEARSIDGSPIYTTHLGHLMFHIWFTSPIGENLRALHITCFHIDITAIDEHELFQAELVDPHRVEEFADTIGHMLLPNVCSPNDRSAITNIYRRSVRHCREIFELEMKRLQDGKITMMHRIAHTCQRMFCMPDNNDIEDFVDQVASGLSVIRATMKGAQGQLPYETVGLFFEEWQLFEMAARLIPIGVANGWEDTTDSLMDTCQLHMVVYHRFLHPDYINLEAAAILKQSFSRVWRPILEELQSIPLDDEGLVGDAKESWVFLGSAMGLSAEKYLPDEEQAIKMHESRRIRCKRCQWHECFCSFHKPEHLMRVCKGCWKRRYCSEKCQTSDWQEGGHRDLCHSRENAVINITDCT